MKIIKVPVEGKIEYVEVETFDYPKLQEATVGVANFIERVVPTMFRQIREERIGIGQNWFVMIVDEDGIRQGLPVNQRASFLYGTRNHGGSIYGDAWIVGEGYTDEGPDFVDLDDDVTPDVIAGLVLVAAVLL